MSVHHNEIVEAVKRRALNPHTRRDQLLPDGPRLRVVAPAIMKAAEAELDCALHPLLKEVYAKIGNGGFGPGYGLLGLADKYREDAKSVTELYREFRDTSWRDDDPEWGDIPDWPERLLPLFDWGSATWSCIDARTPEGVIVTHDDVQGATVTEFTIESWFKAWAAGANLWHEIYEEGEDVPFGDPFTRKIRMIKGPGRAKGRPYA